MILYTSYTHTRAYLYVLYILMALHLNVITWYKPFSRIQFGSIPIHVIFHIQNLQEMYYILHNK